MSTSPNAVSAFMLSLSEFACFVSEQHYHFLLQSLNNLEHQIEQHRAERRLMELRIANLQQQTTQWCPDAMSTSPTSRTPSLLSDIKSKPHRQSFNNHEPPLNPSSHNILLRFFLFCFVYLCLFIIFRSESWRCRFDSLLFDSYRCHTIDS